MRTTCGLVLAAGLVGCGGGREAGGDDAKPAPKGEEVAVTAETLYLAYRDGNPAAADAKYLNKTLRVSGRVLEIEQGPGGGYTIGFETGPNVVASGVKLKAAVVAPLPASARDEAAKMRFRDEVVVVGKFTGKEKGKERMGGLRLPLADAKIVSHTPKK